MAIVAIPVDQRVIDIDSRRFASIEKALVELITNSDDSYARLEKAGKPVSGRIRIRYERHMGGALLVVSDQAEGMAFQRACSILAYGGAHSPLSRGEAGGRGFFGRGLKQAIYGLGHGWMETIHEGRYSRIDLFRSENGGYLYDDGGGDRPATSRDYGLLGVETNGTRVTIVIENRQVSISQFRSLVQAVANNVYLREILERRAVELVSAHHGREVESTGSVRYVEPPATVLLGPEHEGHFVYDRERYPFTITLKRAQGAELTPRGDERTNGLLVVSGLAVLDCQLFAYENQVGTEYLFGTVRCPALIEKLGQGAAIISDEREGLNQKDPFVATFSRAVSRMLAPHVLAEQEKLKHLEHATTSGRTALMIEHLLQRVSQAAMHDLGIRPAEAAIDSAPLDEAGHRPALRFTTPFYYRKPEHPFHVTLLIDSEQLPPDDVVSLTYALPDSMRIEPAVNATPVRQLNGQRHMEWTVVGDTAGQRGEITARAGNYLAWCELVVAEQAYTGHHGYGTGVARRQAQRIPRDHGPAMFLGYEFRNLHDPLERAVYSPTERKIIINTAAPTVQLYLDGRGHFRDAARLLLAELFMDVISDELARCMVRKSGHEPDGDAYHRAKLDIIRRYGSEIHRSFLNT